MNGFQNLKRQLLPLIKGAPIIIIVFAGFLFIAKKFVDYAPNKYQTMAKIQLDNQKYGYSSNSLYEDFDLFTSENKIETEAEILKSPLIIGLAIDSLPDMSVSMYRIGKFKNTMLYDNAPFIINMDSNTIIDANKTFKLSISGKNNISLTLSNETTMSCAFNETISIQGVSLKIEKNPICFDNPQADIDGEYEVTLWNQDMLIKHLASNLDVVPVDKEISVLRIVYTDEHPGRVADFTNELCKAYIRDHVTSKSGAANKAVNFIDAKIEQVMADLTVAERDLESFKMTNNVVNTLQETETGLRHISKLEIQLINLDMNAEAIRELQTYIQSGEYFDETAINFGFGDLLMTELVKKLKLWQDERRDLLTKYTESHETVLAADEKINEIKIYVKEAITQNLKEIEIKQADIKTTLEEASHMFDDLPTREKNHNILDRKFRLLEDVYNFLSKKRIEASISASSDISFHRIIQKATVPEAPISPNKTLIVFVAGFLGLVVGIILVYLRNYTRARVNSREDIERHTALPICGIIRTGNQEVDATQIIKGLLIKGRLIKGSLLSVTSTLSLEGKSYVANQLLVAIQKCGYTACIIGHEDETYNKAKVDALLTSHDFVIADTKPTAQEISAVEWMSHAQFNFYVVRSSHTCINYIAQSDLVVNEYSLDNVEIILNDAHKATNYSGHYLGSRFRKEPTKKGIMGRISYIYKTYVAK